MKKQEIIKLYMQSSAEKKALLGKMVSHSSEESTAKSKPSPYPSSYPTEYPSS